MTSIVNDFTAIKARMGRMDNAPLPASAASSMTTTFYSGRSDEEIIQMMLMVFRKFSGREAAEWITNHSSRSPDTDALAKEIDRRFPITNRRNL